MAIMTTRMHFAAVFGFKPKSGFFFDGKGIHIGSNAHHRSLLVPFQHGFYAGPRNTGCDFQPLTFQIFFDKCGGLLLLITKLWNAMQMPPELYRFGVKFLGLGDKMLDKIKLFSPVKCRK